MKKFEELSLRFLSQSPMETMEIAEEFAASLAPNTVIALQGDLGAGKTTFVKGLAKGLGAADEEAVCSPTYSYMNIYEGTLPLYHFDLYRLSSKAEFQMSGFEEYFFAGGVSCLEWPDSASSTLPKDTVLIDFKHCGISDREITIRRP